MQPHSKGITQTCASPSQKFISKSIRPRLSKKRNVVVVAIVVVVVVAILRYLGLCREASQKLVSWFRYVNYTNLRTCPLKLVANLLKFLQLEKCKRSAVPLVAVLASPLAKCSKVRKARDINLMTYVYLSYDIVHRRDFAKKHRIRYLFVHISQGRV